MVKGRDDDELRRWCEERGQKVERDGKETERVFRSGQRTLRIEDCRESRDDEARLAQIFTVSKIIAKKA
jgi:hypothetical protein